MQLARALAWTILLCSAIGAQALDRIQLCIGGSLPPYSREDGKGYLQQLMREVSKQLPVPIEVHVRPRKRCLAELQRGLSDGTMGTFTLERATYLHYPMRDGKLDESRSAATADFRVYRMVGSQVGWDGRKFSGLADLAVGTQRGYVHAEQLKALGVPYDDGVDTAERNLAKLRAGRLAALVAMEVGVAGQLGADIEAVGPVFDRSVIYVPTSKAFYQRQPQLVEQLWDRIRKVRESPTYQQYLQQYR